MRYTPEEAAKLLANRVNQPHYIEWVISMCIKESKPKIANVAELALLDAKKIAMRNTFAARIPECGDFGGIAQNLAFVCQELEIDES